MRGKGVVPAKAVGEYQLARNRKPAVRRCANGKGLPPPVQRTGYYLLPQYMTSVIGRNIHPNTGGLRIAN
jgi:hypothetical protein